METETEKLVKLCARLDVISRRSGVALHLMTLNVSLVLCTFYLRYFLRLF